MGRTIAIANQKGGVGKTTTAINLAACLAEKGNTVLVIDIDPQGNTTSGLGINKKNLKETVYDMMLGEFIIGAGNLIPNMISDNFSDNSSIKAFCS